MHHKLKTDKAAFKASWERVKPWEIRFNDRKFAVGDYYTLFETVYSGEEMKQGKDLEYTGRTLEGVVELVMEGPVYGVTEGWVILTTRAIGKTTWTPNNPVFIKGIP